MIRLPAGRARLCRGALSAVVAFALAAGLGGCGKRGALQPPPGKESEYKYPRKYPGSPKFEPPIKPASAPKKGDKSDESDKPKAENGASQPTAKSGTTE